MGDNYFKPITEEQARELTLEDDLKKYHEAEFAVDGQVDVEKERAKLVDLLPEAFLTLESMLKNGESEAVRLNAAKFVYGSTIGKALDAGSGDPLGELIKQLQG
jgi:hypothetical protein